MDNQNLTVSLFEMGLMIGTFTIMLIFTVKEIINRIRYEDYIKKLKVQGKFEDWKTKNNKILIQLRFMRWLLFIGYIMPFVISFSPSLEYLSLVAFSLTIPIFLIILFKYHFLYKEVSYEDRPIDEK